eukprot:TRINITY_DN337_c0_g3_i1.p1 TRINITY_DN337_c0_g3~~TRINITY_DN337_c0_g3_i1.p1  ORF type:complete len:603 (-),score=108.64 TRINITY_DN337_c0_g3_i1:108-1916(-)
MAEERVLRFRQLLAKTSTAYTRMGATVVVAVVIRLCMDCIGIILTGQEPTATAFWFAHCNSEEGGRCVLAAFSVFFVSLVGSSCFAWSFQEWLLDPERNPYSRHFSFSIIVDAAAWVPISVVIGKTNALVEWGMNTVEDDLVQALLSSLIAAVLTIVCALLTHFAMVYCHGVQESERTKEAGLAGFFKFFLLATLYSLGWAVAWSNWELVLALMDALDPGRSVHNSVLAAAVILFFLMVSTCFYLRFGPEPIIPDPQLQRLCYAHGYSSSLRRSLVSYGVYSCVVFMVMCFCDPTYGILITLANMVSPIGSVFDATALLVCVGLTFAVTLLAALLSAALSAWMDVDGGSSMKFSRSVHSARQEMVRDQRSRYLALLDKVLVDGTDVHFARSASRRSSKELSPVSLPDALEAQAFLRVSAADAAEEDDEVGGGDEAGGPRSPRCDYSRLPSVTSRPYLDVSGSLGGDSADAFEASFASPEAGHEEAELATERQLRLDPGAISRLLCASVLIYDVLGLVVCSVWGSVALRGYSVLLGRLAALHSVLYLLSCVVYAGGVVALVSRLVFLVVPSREERRCALRPRSGSDEVATRLVDVEMTGCSSS